MMDEAEIGPVDPPPRPTTVPLALQQAMPLAEVLDFIAQPPGRCGRGCAFPSGSTSP
jgi:hypothetical protein